MFQKGLFLGFGLITNLGIQNTFLARQAFVKNRAWFCATVCLLCDMLLIAAAMLSSNFVLQTLPALKLFFLVFAIFFLLHQGGSALISFFKKNSNIDIESSGLQQSVQRLLFICLCFSLLNPNALLDTFVILGGVSTSLHGWQKFDFAIGAMVASAIWFYGLIFLVQRFKHRISWPWFNFLSGLIMMVTALLCLKELVLLII